ANGAGLGDDLPVAAALRADARGQHGAEQRLGLGPHLARAAAGRARLLAAGAGLGPVAVAVLASDHALDGHAHRLPGPGLLQRHLDLDLEVLARLALAASRPAHAHAAHPAPEHGGEDVEDVHAHGHAVVDAAVAVVAAPLLRVREDGVRLVDLLETLLGLLVAGVAVGVVLEGEAPVRGLYLGGIGVAFDPEERVVVGHAPAV